MLPSAWHKKRKKNTSAFAITSEKRLHSKDIFALRVRREEAQRGGYYHIVETQLTEEVGGKKGGFECAERKM